MAPEQASPVHCGLGYKVYACRSLYPIMPYWH